MCSRTVPTFVTAHSTFLRISRYLGWVVPTYTSIFLRGLKRCGSFQNLASALGIQKENWRNRASSEIIKLQFGKERHTLLCILLLCRIIIA